MLGACNCSEQHNQRAAAGLSMFSALLGNMEQVGSEVGEGRAVGEMHAYLGASVLLQHALLDSGKSSFAQGTPVCQAALLDPCVSTHVLKQHCILHGCSEAMPSAHAACGSMHVASASMLAAFARVYAACGATTCLDARSALCSFAKASNIPAQQRFICRMSRH